MAFMKLSLFFHKLLFIMNTLFPLLPEMLCTLYVNLFAEASELFMHTMFELIVIHKTASQCILQGSEKWRSEVSK